MSEQFPAALAVMGDEELAFRGWTREGMKKRWETGCKKTGPRCK